MLNIKTIALAGNPNVGKSTIFNKLTGLKQHTGNWSGKTVTNTKGEYVYNNTKYVITDIPGTYSLTPNSHDEKIASDFIRNGNADCIVVVCDATCLERNLILVLQTLETSSKVVVCLNLMDQARKKNIKIDCDKLAEILNVPIVTTNATKNVGMENLMKIIEKVCNSENIAKADLFESNEEHSKQTVLKAEEICNQVINYQEEDYNRQDRKIDKILTGKITAFPIMFLLLALVFWITIIGANYPSKILSDLFISFQPLLQSLLNYLHLPSFIVGMIVDGLYRTLSWVVSVMLPPMVIFFPLFTLLEDLGYLPRIAFNLDRCFACAKTCGKQALTMCMGFGCNAVGVTGCRIINSPRERMIAILTNVFIPCNGRFPTLISIITMFLIINGSSKFASVWSALILALFIGFSILITFLVSNLLSKTILKGTPSSFVLELPPYRKPQILSVIVRSIFDRSLFVLGRAVTVAVPAGVIIWLMANCQVDNKSILLICADFLNPFATLMGLDGIILIAFILGFPANEIVIPIIIMAYLSCGKITEITDLNILKNLFVENGWTYITAISTMLFSIMHWPCSTTLLTIKKETKSLKWTAFSFCLPTVIGIVVCMLFANIARLFV